MKYQMAIFKKRLMLEKKGPLEKFGCLMAVRLLGPRFAFCKLRGKIHEAVPHLVLVKDLSESGMALSDELTISRASGPDVAQFFDLMMREGETSRYEFLRRRKFYQQGFRTCYITRRQASNEMCSIYWSITSDEVKLTRSEKIYGKLCRDEVFGENIYTLEKFRGCGIMNWSGRAHESLLRQEGFSRMFFFVRENNTASLKSSARRGHLVDRRVIYRHILGIPSLRVLEKFDPPVALSILYPGYQ